MKNLKTVFVARKSGVQTSVTVSSYLLARPNGKMVQSKYYRFKRAYMFIASNGAQTVGILRARFIPPEMSELSKEFIFAILLVSFVTEDYTCPFCSLECASYKGLEYHLPASHDLFNYEFWGTYLAPVTRSGCLTVHKYETLYSESDQGKDEKKQLRHFSLFDDISNVRWNPSNQDEIAYTSMRTGELTMFDIEYSQITQALSKRPHVTHGLSNIAFLNDGMRVLVSDTSGALSMWDRRVSDLPQSFLTTKKSIGLTTWRSIRLGLYIYGIYVVKNHPLVFKVTRSELRTCGERHWASKDLCGCVNFYESKSSGRLLSINKAYLYHYLSMLLLVPFIHLMTPLLLEP